MPLCRLLFTMAASPATAPASAQNAARLPVAALVGDDVSEGDEVSVGDEVSTGDNVPAGGEPPAFAFPPQFWAAYELRRLTAAVSAFVEAESTASIPLIEAF